MSYKNPDTNQFVYWQNDFYLKNKRNPTAQEAYEHIALELAAMTQRAEAAEARIKASQEQEPVDVATIGNALLFFQAGKQISCPSKLYYAPVVPPDVAELQRENAELARKLAELQVHLDATLGQLQCACSYEEPQHVCEYHRKFLAEAKSKAVPEGMILVQADRITFGDCYRFGLNPNDIVTRSAAPQPGG